MPSLVADKYPTDRTPAASGLRLAPTTQRSRQPRGSLSLRSLGVSLAPFVNDTLLSPFRTHAYSNSEANASTSHASLEFLPSRSFDPASVSSATALSERRSLRFGRSLLPVGEFLGGCLSAMPSSSNVRTPHAVANQPRTPNKALQRTAPGCHGGCSPQSLPRSRRASPPPSLSLWSLGAFSLRP